MKTDHQLISTTSSSLIISDRDVIKEVNKSSIFKTTLYWLRMTMGIGIMTIPFYISQLGLLGGILAIILAGVLTIMKFSFIFRASERVKINDYSELVKKTQKPIIFQIFRWFHMIELFCIFSIFCITAWDVLKSLLFMIGLYKDIWIEDIKVFKWREYQIEVFFIRFGFYFFMFLINLPFMFINKISSQNLISLFFLFTLLSMVFTLIVESPWKHISYQDSPQYIIHYGIKEFKLNHISVFFSIILSFYVQPFILSLKLELANPNLKRLRSVYVNSGIIEIFLFLIIGCVAYICYGDNFLPELLLLRPTTGQGKFFEALLKIQIVLFFFANALGLPVFTPTIKNYVKLFLEVNDSKIQKIFVNIIPFVFGFIFAIFLPSITTIFWILGTIICNFTGFIIPTLLEISGTSQKSFKRLLLYGLICVYVILGFLGSINKLFKSSNNQVINIEQFINIKSQIHQISQIFFSLINSLIF